MTTAERPKSFKISDKFYFKARELKKYDPAYFLGTSRTIRGIVKKKNIPTTQILYASLSKRKGWTPATNQSKPHSKANLLFLEEWVLKNIPKMTPLQTRTYKYPPAPHLLHLEDLEKFQDDAGNIMEIETRGERTPKGIFFLAKDVSDVFEIPSLTKNACHNYEKNEDYKVFLQSEPYKVRFVHDKRQIFLTYEGVIKTLYTSRSKKAKTFRKWATEILFTVQMGTEDQKTNLAAKIIGHPARSVRAVFKTFSRQVPAVYRFALGKVKDLRKSMSLPDSMPDDFTVIKYGLSEDLDRRTAEHIRTYEKIPNVNLGLMNFVYIDPKFLFQAEVDIKEFFESIESPIKYKSFTELVAIDPKHEKQVHKQFKYIGSEYSGALTDLKNQIQKLELSMEKLQTQHQMELIKKDHIIALKDKDLEAKDLVINLKEKDNEILILRLELCKKN